MDLGVGSFVFSGGLVSSRQPDASALRQIWTSIRSSATILIIGVVRTVLTKNLEYQVCLEKRLM
jgi:glucosaminylphosphatidylinositol acyltransferase